jgi:hypothetical protein
MYWPPDSHSHGAGPVSLAWFFSARAAAAPEGPGRQPGSCVSACHDDAVLLRVGNALDLGEAAQARPTLLFSSFGTCPRTQGSPNVTAGAGLRGK